MATPRYAMHPLDAVSLDGFEIVATADVLLRVTHDRAWQALAVDSDESLYADAAAVHDVVQAYGPGEHRCTTTVVLDGRTICVRGLRRLLAHHEVIEVRHVVDHDELVRTTFGPARFGRTRMTVDVGVRPRGRHGAEAVRAVRTWTRPAERCAAADRRLASVSLR